ncbi:hypothetical protein BC936DRAFT_145410, partial [Jimgerdemannia flammicorona]
IQTQGSTPSSVPKSHPLSLCGEATSLEPSHDVPHGCAMTTISVSFCCLKWVSSLEAIQKISITDYEIKVLANVLRLRGTELRSTRYQSASRT